MMIQALSNQNHTITKKHCLDDCPVQNEWPKTVSPPPLNPQTCPISTPEIEFYQSQIFYKINRHPGRLTLPIVHIHPQHIPKT